MEVLPFGEHRPPTSPGSVCHEDLLLVQRLGCGLVARCRSQVGNRGTAVAAATSDLLVIAVHGLGHTGVHDAAYIVEVDTQPEGGGADDDVVLGRNSTMARAARPALERATTPSVVDVAVNDGDSLHPRSVQSLGPLSGVLLLGRVQHHRFREAHNSPEHCFEPLLFRVEGIQEVSRLAAQFGGPNHFGTFTGTEQVPQRRHLLLGERCTHRDCPGRTPLGSDLSPSPVWGSEALEIRAELVAPLFDEVRLVQDDVVQVPVLGSIAKGFTEPGDHSFRRSDY
ncbi:hypothetical protein SHIRM173S_10246 [Streptomyces hirsutus]